MVPKNITKEHVLQAIEDIDKNGIRFPLAKSTVYDLIFREKNYPPKHVIAIANEHANGELLNHTEFTTQMAQRLLLKLDPEFQIVKKSEDPVRRMIENYKEELVAEGFSDELYKWEMLNEDAGRPELDGPDYIEEINRLTYGNLVFYNTIRVRKHILIDNGKAYRDALSELFDEKLELQQRIVSFRDRVLKVYRSLEQTLGHHHDERAIATFLTIKYPGRYTFYKDSLYRKYCNKIGVRPVKSGEKYVHYLALIQDLIDRYIAEDDELLELVQKNLPENVYQDREHKLLAQDILYKMLDKKENTFKSVIDELKSLMPEQDNILREFSFGKMKDSGLSGKNDSYLWIKDALRQIGKTEAHYEVSIRSRGKMVNCFFVDIHFESKEKDRFFQYIGTDLPEDLEWIPWQDAQSIGHKNGISPSDDDVVEKIMEQLLYIETHMGEKVRTVLALGNGDDTIAPKRKAQELNQILYGPPGTGKTYHTIDRALEIVDNVFFRQNRGNRNLLTKRFKELLIDDFENAAGQIAFCTFHQSMAYEDFIEGIKPVAPKGTEDTVNYRVTDGLFKRLCLEATKTKSISGFDEAYEQFVNDVIENENTLVLHTPKLKKPFNTRINSNHNIVSIPQTANATEMVVTKTMVMNYMLHGMIDDWKSYTIAISDYIKENYPFTFK